MFVRYLSLFSVILIFMLFSCRFSKKIDMVFYENQLESQNINKIGFAKESSSKYKEYIYSLDEKNIKLLDEYRIRFGNYSVVFNFDKEYIPVDAGEIENVCCKLMYSGEIDASEINLRLLPSMKTSSHYSIAIATHKNLNPVSFVTNIPVKDIEIVPVFLGWDKEKMLFAFSDTGFNSIIANDLDFYKMFDFSNASNLFNISNYPCITVSLYPIDDIGKYTNQKRVRAKYGDEEFSIRRCKIMEKAVLQTIAFEESYTRFEITDNIEMVKSVLMNEKPLESNIYPLITDPGLIFDWPQATWRNESFEIFEWEQFPNVLIFDMKNFAIQNQFFTRLAYFVEKEGFKGCFVSDEFIIKESSYNAHDYSAKSLASFFEKALLEDFPLNDYEVVLRTILLENGIIEYEAGHIKEGRGAVLSISRESPSYSRRTLLYHEGWHGIYFTDEEFRAFCKNVYESMDYRSKDFLQSYWSLWDSLNYDLSDIDLMYNETMAYLLQQPINKVSSYYMHLASFYTVMRKIPEKGKYVKDTKGMYFRKTAEELNEYVYNRWGLAAGRVSLVNR